jgi:hypothetical protein
VLDDRRDDLGGGDADRGEFKARHTECCSGDKRNKDNDDKSGARAPLVGEPRRR